MTKHFLPVVRIDCRRLTCCCCLLSFLPFTEITLLADGLAISILYYPLARPSHEAKPHSWSILDCICVSMSHPAAELSLNCWPIASWLNIDHCFNPLSLYSFLATTNLNEGGEWTTLATSELEKTFYPVKSLDWKMSLLNSVLINQVPHGNFKKNILL